MGNKNKDSVIHRDLKLENIMVDDRNNIKLIDFGFAVVAEPGQKLRTMCGTPSYMAPELVQRREYNGYATDVWAFGIIAFVMLAGNFPFKGQNEKDLFAKISRGLFRCPEGTDFDTKRFLNKILVLDPEKRPSAHDIANDRWLRMQKLQLFSTGRNIF
jgi:serine/threonine protein kinase